MTSIEWLENELKKSIHYYRLVEDIESKSTIVQSNIFEQAKEMLDKEMCKFAEFVSIYSNKNRNVNGEMLHAKSKYDESERTIDLLEIFRKINNK